MAEPHEFEFRERTGDEANNRARRDSGGVTSWFAHAATYLTGSCTSAAAAKDVETVRSETATVDFEGGGAVDQSLAGTAPSEWARLVRNDRLEQQDSWPELHAEQQSNNAKGDASANHTPQHASTDDTDTKAANYVAADASSHDIASVRRVDIGETSPHIDNTVTTSKYTIVSFLPLALFGQFRRFANLYFLLGGLLMLFGERTNYFLSPYQSSTTLGPLAVVICISLLQEALTDVARHKADSEVNMRSTDVLNSEGESKIIAQYQVRTGQILRVENGDMIPADLVILATSTEANTCYIDTASIDGETTLKIRRAPLLENAPSWMSEAAPKDERKLHDVMATLKGIIECDHPNERINRFTGTLRLDGHPSAPLGKDHVVLRGSSLHTDWILGVAVYTGQETKLALNARTPPQKLSRIDKTCNRVVLAIFCCQLTLALITTIIGNQWESAEFENLWYIGFRNNKTNRQVQYLDSRWPDLETTSKQTNFGWAFCTFLILYVNFIPLSLYVSLELCFQALTFFVNWDISMYHKETNTPALARSPTVTDLGQVEYVFSDKTGTLTRNEMKLRFLIVHGVTYAVPEQQPDPPFETEVRSAPSTTHALSSSTSKFAVEPVTGLTARATYEADDLAAILLESLMLCNTVVVETKGDTIKYQAESPDEGALVDGGAVAGYTLSARTEHILCGETPAVKGARRTWQILATNEFDNDRKRMSIFVREQFDEDHAARRNDRPMLPDAPSTRGSGLVSTGGSGREGGAGLRGRVLLLCKGADSSMFAVAAAENAGIDDMRRKLDGFAREGLRTLVFGFRVFSEEQWQAWYSTYYQPASVALQNRDELLTRASHEAEKELVIVGASAIEDKLQLGVPETIATLANAGIKLWVLTGDKRETAIEIGKSCRLLRPGMPLAILASSASNLELEAALVKLYKISGAAKKFANDKQHQQLVSEKLRELSDSGEQSAGGCQIWTQRELDDAAFSGIPKALVIDGEAMANLFGDQALEAIVFGVLATCGSVIACRVTPKQKAQLVKLVQQHVSPTPVTLAIGDGANDVNMIMSAQVGVGISGHEGLQAVNASDFAIAQFRFLQRLLLVHGRWGYRRVAILVLYSFYKNACLAATLFLFCFFTGYSGTSLFSDYFTALFNFFLFLLIFYTSIFDQDVSVEYVYAHPQLYVSGLENKDLSVRLALQWILVALIHACIIFLLPAFALRLGTGERYDLGAYQPFGATISCGFIVYMNVKVLFETRYFTNWFSGWGKQRGRVGILASTWFAATFNFLFFYLGLVTASFVGDGTSFIFQLLPFWNVGNVVLAQPSTWAITFLVIVACGAVDLALYAGTLFFNRDAVAVSIERHRLMLDSAFQSSTAPADIDRANVQST